MTSHPPEPKPSRARRLAGVGLGLGAEAVGEAARGAWGAVKAVVWCGGLMLNSWWFDVLTKRALKRRLATLDGKRR